MLAAENAYRVAQARVGEVSARHGQEFALARAQVEASGQELNRLRLQYESATNELTTSEEKRPQLQTARLVDAATRVRFENIGKDTFPP